ncbi:zinc finger matrin-type protein 4 isoform X2 [Vicugna pacos]|uniref:Zinc finger matrin-type protein 4 isoform X2 n=1 Tax=Vicugna pacos TaxID=30538 RepID=A0ABM5CCB9_VICPA
MAAATSPMKSSDLDQDLFTDSYCKVCSAQLISESQRVAHYESRKHASKVRLYYMLHPRDGGCPAKKLRSENGSDADMVDKNKCCTLCNMSFTSAVVADSHYQGKIHAKRLKLLLGEKTPLKTTGADSQPGSFRLIISSWCLLNGRLHPERCCPSYALCTTEDNLLRNECSPFFACVCNRYERWRTCCMRTDSLLRPG